VKWIKITPLWVVIAACITLLFQARLSAQSGRLRLAEGLIGALGLIAVLWPAVMQERKRLKSRPKG
jgi:hypothetical protein